MAGAICEQSRGWCTGSLLAMPLSSGRFPKPDPPHPGTQGRGGVKTWRAFAGSPLSMQPSAPRPHPAGHLWSHQIWAKTRMMTEVFQFALEVLGGSGGVGGWGRGRAGVHGRRTDRNAAMTPFLEKRSIFCEICFNSLKNKTHCCDYSSRWPIVSRPWPVRDAARTLHIAGAAPCHKSVRNA